MFSDDEMEVCVFSYVLWPQEATLINVKRPKGATTFIDVTRFYYYYISFLIGNFIIKK
jgi:hypothetical protein